MEAVAFKLSTFAPRPARKLRLPAKSTRESIAYSGLALLLLAAAGCRQVDFTTSNLPPQYAAPATRSFKEFDLSGLAQTAARNETIYPGDVVQVIVSTPVSAPIDDLESAGHTLRVNEEGFVSHPEIGPIRISGMAVTQAELAIKEESIRRGKYVDPNVTLFIKHPRVNRITVMGAVEEPGPVELRAAGSDLLAAINQAGGLTDDAGTVIEIRHPPQLPSLPISPMGHSGNWQRINDSPFRQVGFRPGVEGSRQYVRVDLEEIAAGQSRPNLRLDDGSVVMVMKKPTQYVHVIGLVNLPDQVEIPFSQNLRLLDAIAKAGGTKVPLADKVYVIRHPPGEDRAVVIRASISAAKSSRGRANLRLAPGDVVSVEETPLTFAMGMVQSVIRFGFSGSIPLF